MTVMGNTHELIDSKATTKNPFPLKVHEIIPGLLVRGPGWGALEGLERGESISKFYALLFKCIDRFRGIGTSWRLCDFVQERGEDCLGIERHSYGGGSIRL